MNNRSKVMISALAILLAVLMFCPVLSMTASASEGKRINSKTAEAYLKVLNNIIDSYGICKTTYPDEEGMRSSGLAYVELIDFNNDGSEELYLTYIIGSPYYGDTSCVEELWYFNGNSAIKAFSREHHSDGSHVGGDSNGRALHYSSDGKVYLVEKGSFLTGMGPYGSTTYMDLDVYEFDGTDIKEKAKYADIIGEGKRNEETFEVDDKVYFEYEFTIDGETIKDSFEDVGRSNDYSHLLPSNVKDFINIISENKKIIYAGSYIPLSWEVNDVKAVMESLIIKAPSYKYKKINDEFNERDIENLAKLIAEKLNGKIIDIYKLSDGIYYVIIEIDSGGYGGVVVKELKSDNERLFKIEKVSEEAMAQEMLDEYVANINSIPNIFIDYNEASKFENISDFVEYLNNAIDNVDGIAVNDAGKSEIVKYIESAITNLPIKVIPAKNNKISLKAKDIEGYASSAKNSINEFLSTLSERNVNLNKDVILIIRIDITNINYEKPLQLTLDSSILDTLSDVDSIKILLGSNRYGLNFTTENLKAIFKDYDVLNIQVYKTADDSYNITFADENESVISKLPSSIGFFMPAESELATVLASFDGINDNWGGQYDAVNSFIEFQTKYTGNYEILENSIEIDDIDEVSPEQRQAINFMVSKNYFNLEGSSFKPLENLTRYDFTEALVRMFFALDKDAKTSFTDVLKDSKYYSIVSSAQKDSIVEGYDDNTFRGELYISKEQVIVLCARTLAEKKGYSYPENYDDYIIFFDREDISDWAVKDIALAVREGLIDGTGNLSPKDNINRADSAEMLYKLFMLLYETSPVEFVVNETQSNNNIIVPIVGGIVAVGGVAGGIILKKKKSRAI